MLIPDSSRLRKVSSGEPIFRHLPDDRGDRGEILVLDGDQVNLTSGGGELEGLQSFLGHDLTPV